MAETPADTDLAFLREVDEGVRRDQVASLWQRFGVVGVTLLVLLLATLAGAIWWRDDQLKKAGVAGEDFVAAMEKLDVGEGASARPVLDRLAADGPGGYATLARMMQADDAATGNDKEKATKLLDAVAADEKTPQPLRDAALLKSVRLNYDSLAPDVVIDRLKSLSVPGNPWFGIAGEMTAIAQIRAGKVAPAKVLLTAIVRDDKNSPSVRSRAAQLALSLGVAAETLQPVTAPAK